MESSKPYKSRSNLIASEKLIFSNIAMHHTDAAAQLIFQKYINLLATTTE